MGEKKSLAAKIESILFSSLSAKPKSKYGEGDLAPSFILLENGKEFHLNPGDGRWKVIYFYPKDDTPGCTAQAKAFTALMERFQKVNADIIGISKDSAESHEKFRQKHGLKIKLYVDPGMRAATDFGVRQLKGMCSRDSVLINPEGKVEKIFRGVDPKANPLYLLEYIEGLSKKDK